MDLKKVLDEYYNLKLSIEDINTFEITLNDLTDLANHLENYYQNNIYFLLQLKLMSLQNSHKYKEIAYINYLISAYIFFILTPIVSNELAFCYAMNALKLDEKNIRYKAWILYFPDELENKLKIDLAKEVLKYFPDNCQAKEVIIESKGGNLFE